MRSFVTIIFCLLLFVVSALFFAQNDAVVIISYFSGQLEWQLNWVMVLCLVLGFCIGIASIIGSLFAARFRLRQAKSKMDRQEQELNSLRALPTKDDY